MKKVTILSLALLFAVAGSAFAQEEQILHLSGNAWEDDGPGGTFPPSNPGDGFNAVGLLNDIEEPLVWDTLNYSYTFHVRNLVSAGGAVFGTTHVVSYVGGLFTIYVDWLPSNADYGTNPPNATSPSTFTDGISTYLDGFFTDFTLTFNTATQSGSFAGGLTFTGGDVYPLLNAAEGWVFGANIAGFSPTGYDLEVNGDVSLQIVSVDEQSWGNIKNLYR
jgi:hypothetical protein